MILMHVIYSLKPGLTPEDLYAALERADIPRLTRGEEGCLSYDFCFDPQRPGCLRLFEQWESEERLSAHRATPQFFALQELKGRYVASTEFQRFDVR